MCSHARTLATSVVNLAELGVTSGPLRFDLDDAGALGGRHVIAPNHVVVPKKFAN